MKITSEAFASLVVAFLTRMPIVERVQRTSDDSARVVLKNGQSFSVVVIQGAPKAKEGAGDEPKPKPTKKSSKQF